ncbi:MAG: reverse transcriptase domain-containing protein [Vicinamibacterales bacterium]
MGIRPFMPATDIMSVATDRRVLSLLVRARMSVRRQRRDNSFYHRLAANGRNPRAAVEAELAELFPPRRDWPTPGQPARRRAAQNGTDPVSVALVDWILSQFGAPRRTAPSWLNRLRRVVGQIRTRVRDWGPGSELAAPHVYALLKSRAVADGEPDAFRCLAVYGLIDRIVISIAARYFRQLTDESMHSGSLAFRTQMPPLTHHDAVERIVRFRCENQPSETWVTEVDIRGFFDVVSHDVARRAVKRLLDRLQAGTRVDPRAEAILEAYLDSYAFNMGGQGRALAQARRQQRAGHDVQVPWPDDALRKLGVDIKSERVGIPQGGALSCFLANAILDLADWQVAAAYEHAERALYLRYCDDIVCLAPSQERCQAMMDAYTAALVELRLPAHPPLPFDRPYEKGREGLPGGFWKGKSKAPYRWAAPGQAGSVPWCSFVGYQVRFDGVLRIRPSSVKKEVDKHHDILSQVKRFISRHGQVLSRRRILYRVRQRLRAIAVGSGSVRKGRMPPPFSWAQGFHLIGRHDSLIGQLRELDRHRVATVSRLRRRLEGKGKSSKEPKAPVDVLKFEGFPFSYAGLAERDGKRSAPDGGPDT